MLSTWRPVRALVLTLALAALAVMPVANAASSAAEGADTMQACPSGPRPHWPRQAGP